jgi:magnesium chelatase family protein
MLARVQSASVLGIDAYLVEVEVDLSLGTSLFTTVGLPDGAVKESKDRVQAAIKNSGFKFPLRKITVNLAPADVKKEGAAFDLPIAVGILAAAGEVQQLPLRDYIMLGELSLDGSLRPVRGVISIALDCRSRTLKGIILPRANAAEAAIVTGVNVYPADTLGEVVGLLNGMLGIEPARVDTGQMFQEAAEYSLDFADVKGQESAKRALEVAAAGAHNILLLGPPGSGKTMLARRLPTILPPLELDEALDATRIHSVAGTLSAGSALVATRPFRSPHHTISDAGLIGGGAIPKPGEVSLAHNGVLFLDELPEFHRNVLEVLRQPLEDGSVTVGRAKVTLSFPARFTLVAAMNPCPCGYHSDPNHACSCTPHAIQKYRGRISGPLLDRIDLQIPVPALKYEELSRRQPGEPSAAIRDRVTQARKVQLDRFRPLRRRRRIFANAQLETREIRRFCPVSPEGDRLLRNAIDSFGYSARAYDRILKVARTIADLEARPDIEPPHISEAIQYRSLDRSTWR